MSHTEVTAPRPDKGLPVAPAVVPPAARAAVLAALFATAFAIRVDHITAPPYEFHPVRQFHSMIVTRRIERALRMRPAEPQERSASLLKSEPILEPPVMELIAVAGYRIAGGDRIWIPRAAAMAFWLLGGAFLLILARRLFSPDAAVVSVAVYLFLPFGIAASRSFQPEPLMVMLLVAALCGIARYCDAPSRPAWLLAAAASAAAVLAKPVALFPIAGAFLLARIDGRGARRGLAFLHAALFVAAVVAPAALYAAAGTWCGLIPAAQGTRFMPHLLLQPSFWGRWGSLLAQVFGPLLLVAALAGLALSMRRRGTARGVLAGAWLGYVLYGMAFIYFSATHDYYHLPLVPVVALSCAPLADALLRAARRRGLARVCAAAGMVALALGVLHGSRAGRRLCVRAGGEAKIRVAREVGEAVGHSRKTIFLADSYGLPLVYYGDLDGRYWPSRTDLWAYSLKGARPRSPRERFHAMTSVAPADYFIVTALADFHGQADLEQFLTEEFPILQRTQDHLIFDLRRGAGAAPGGR